MIAPIGSTSMSRLPCSVNRRAGAHQKAPDLQPPQENTIWLPKPDWTDH